MAPGPERWFPDRVHMVGACGSGMKALAELLSDGNCSLTGSDREVPDDAEHWPFKAGIHAGHSADHLHDDLDALIHSPAVPESNVEVSAAIRRGVPVYSLHQAIGKLMTSRTGICVAGTHGKSTATAAVSWSLRSAGLEPSCLFGANLRSTTEGEHMPCSAPSLSARSGWLGTGTHFVVESCEFQSGFLHYQPSVVLLLNIEHDHTDCFPTEQCYVENFQNWLDRLPPDTTIIRNRDCKRIQTLNLSKFSRQLSFGTHEESDFRISAIDNSSGQGVAFQLQTPHTRALQVQTSLSHRHDTLTAAAVFAVHSVCTTTEPQWGEDRISTALKTFPGLQQRFQLHPESDRLVWIDDYAHHPTAIEAVLTTARERYSNRRLIAIFQPHQHGRTLAFFTSFAEALALADRILLAPAFAAREIPGPEHVSVVNRLAKEICDQKQDSGSASHVPDLDHLRSSLEDTIRPGDVLLTLGAGDMQQRLALSSSFDSLD